jgi:hypothetical protein
MEQTKNSLPPAAPEPSAPLSQEQMLADADALLAEFALDYERMAQ